MAEFLQRRYVIFVDSYWNPIEITWNDQDFSDEKKPRLLINFINFIYESERLNSHYRFYRPEEVHSIVSTVVFLETFGQ